MFLFYLSLTVQMKRILSFTIIFLVLLSSTRGLSQNDWVFKGTLGQAQTGTQLLEDSEDTVQEFRKTIKISLSNTIKTRSYNSTYDVRQLIFEVIRRVRHVCYLQKRHSSNPSVKLFINLSSLLI